MFILYVDKYLLDLAVVFIAFGEHEKYKPRFCFHIADPWLFATTFLMRLTTHDKLSYMETESRFVFFMFPKGNKYNSQIQQIFIYI